MRFRAAPHASTAAAATTPSVAAADPVRRRSATRRRTVVVAVVTLGMLAAGVFVPAHAGIGEAFGGWAWDKVSDGIAKWILKALSSLVEGALHFLETSSEVDIRAEWFSGKESPYAAVVKLSAFLTCGFAFLGILAGVLRGDPAATLSRVAVAIPLTAFATAVTVEVTAAALELVDVSSEWVLSAGDDGGTKFLRGFSKGAADYTGGFAVVLVALVGALAAMALWAELLVRSALVYLIVALSPVVFAATQWPLARGVLRRAGEVFVALLVSKFVVCVALAVGVAAMGGAGDADSTTMSLNTLLVGAAMLVVASFSPFLVLRLIPVVETAALAQGVSRAPLRSAQSGVSTAVTVASLHRLATGGGVAAGGSASTAGPTLTGGSAAPTAGGSGSGGGGNSGGAATARAAGSASATTPPASNTTPPLGGSSAAASGTATATARSPRRGSRG